MLVHLKLAGTGKDRRVCLLERRRSEWGQREVRLGEGTAGRGERERIAIRLGEI